MCDICLSSDFLTQISEIFKIAEENLDKKTINCLLDILDVMGFSN